MTFGPPPDPARLNLIMQAVDDAFRAHEADSIERIDVLAKATGFALAWSEPPDANAAAMEFMRMTVSYRDRFALLKTPPGGTA
jgi:hypothetical protein